MSAVDLAKPFQFPLDDLSSDRLNAKTVMVDTSLNIFNFRKTPGQFFIPRDTGNGYIKDQPYFISTDGTQTIPLGMKIHTHSIDTDIDGGLLADSLRLNAGNIVAYFGNTFIDTDFVKDVGSGGTVTSTSSGSTGKVVMTTGTSTNAYANIRRLGLSLNFGKNSVFMARMTLTGTIANYLLRVGLNAEMINDANDPTTKSYGIEACSGQTNFQTWSCDGTTRSTVATSYAVDTSNHTWMGQHSPATPNVVFTKDFDTGNSVTKVTDIPVSGGSDSNKFFMAGVKTTTSTQSKDWDMRAVVVYGKAQTSGWVWYNS